MLYEVITSPFDDAGLKCLQSAFSAPERVIEGPISSNSTQLDPGAVCIVQDIAGYRGAEYRHYSIGAGRPRTGRQKFFRITSYNVCYTKLLRDGRLVSEQSANSRGPRATALLYCFGCAGDGCQAGLLHPGLGDHPVKLCVELEVAEAFRYEVDVLWREQGGHWRLV